MDTRTPRSLRAQLALAFGLASLLMLGGLSWSLGERARLEGLRDQSGVLSNLAHGVAQTMSDALQTGLVEVGLLATTPPADAAGWARALHGLQQGRQHYTWLGVTDAQGRVRHASAGLLLGADVSARPWFIGALAGPFVGDVHTAKLLAKLVPSRGDGPLRFVDFAMPLPPGPDGRPAGVIAVHADWAFVQDVIDRLRGPLRRGQGVRVFVLDQRGEVIHRPRDTALDDAPPSLAGLREGHVAALRWNGDAEYLSSWVRVPARVAAADLGWRVVVRQPLAEATRAAREQRQMVLLLGGLAALLLAGLGYLLVSRLTAPLRGIVAAARRVERGELDAELPEVTTARELRTLSRSLRGMTETLRAHGRELEARVQARTQELEQAQAGLQQLNEELARQARHDALTGLLNRRAGDEHLAREVARHRRHGQPLALALADIDHFKQVNDRHGHAAGDAVLRDVAAVLQRQCRSSDVVVRMGGEEFLVLMPQTDAAGARAAAEKLRAAVQAQAMQVPVTLSLGVAVDVQAYAQVEAALDVADQALYAAKRGGRNRVELATTLAAEAGEYAAAEA